MDTTDGGTADDVAAWLALGPAAAARLALLEAVLDAAPAFVHVLRGPEFVFEYANPAYCQLVGRRDLVGRPAFAALPEAAAGGYQTRIARVMATGEPFVGRELPVTLARTPGAAPEERLLDLTYLPLHLPLFGPTGAGTNAAGTNAAGGAASRVLGYGTDVTDNVRARRTAEGGRERLLAALEVERARLAAVFRRAPAFLAVMRGPDHVFELVNDAYARLVGFRDVVGQPVWAALPEVRGQGFEALLDTVFRTGEPFVGREIPITVAATPGAPPEERFLDFNYQPLVESPVGESPVGESPVGESPVGTDAGGEERVVGVIAHGVDVTEQVRARRDTERLLAAAEVARAEAEVARAAAEQAARAKAEFLATMSHEIRTPINAIVGYTQLLELGIPDPVTPAQQGQLGRVTASARHLLGLVNDVLDVAKLDAGEVRVAREHATTGPAVAAALALVGPQADQRGVRLVEDRPRPPAGLPAGPRGGVPYVGDEARVRQILVNLLANAVKFTEAGGTVTVTSGTREDAPPAARVEGAGPWAYVRVTDTGVGIAPERQAAVFEPFVQAEAGHTRTYGGTGLGLTISRRLARVMGGDLTLERALRAGSTFTLWLPAPGAAAGDDATVLARGDRAGLPGAGRRVHGLGEIGRALREEADSILEAYTTTLRADPEAPLARAMRRAQLEDHAITLLADLAQSLVILDNAGEEAAALTGDGTAIQRAIAEAHGARRCAQGWDERALRRDHAVLHDVVERAVRARVAARAGDVSDGLRVLAQLEARTEALSVAAYRHAREVGAAKAGGAGAAPAA